MAQKFLEKLTVIGWQERARVQRGNEGEKEDRGVEADIEIGGRIIELSTIKMIMFRILVLYLQEKQCNLWHVHPLLAVSEKWHPTQGRVYGLQGSTKTHLYNEALS